MCFKFWKIILFVFLPISIMAQNHKGIEVSLYGAGLVPLGNLAFTGGLKNSNWENYAKSGGYGLDVSYRITKYSAVSFGITHTLYHQKYYDINTLNTLFTTQKNILRFTPGFYLTYPIKWFEPRLNLGFSSGLMFRNTTLYNAQEQKFTATLYPFTVFGFRMGPSFHFFPMERISLFAGVHFNYAGARFYKYFWETDFVNGKKENTEKTGWKPPQTMEDPYMPYNFALPFSNIEITAGISYNIPTKLKNK